MSAPTAAILVIGDEILSGKTEDTNARLLIHELRELGVGLKRIVIVPDEIKAVADAIRELAGSFEYVFTSGGVGPTHDDVTIAGIASGLEVDVVRHPELEAKLRSYFGDSINESRLRMADVPDGSELIEAPDLRWPVVCTRNVYVLPGVPDLFRKKFAAIRERFRVEPFFVETVYTREDEFDLAERLRRVAASYPHVAIGSYPDFTSSSFKVKVTLESKNSNELASAVKALLAELDPERVVTLK